MLIQKYKIQDFPFDRLVKKCLGWSQLSDCHNLVEHLKKIYGGKGMKEYNESLFKIGEDSSTILHAMFYKQYHDGWKEMEDLYLKFIKEVIAPEYDEDILYQCFPTVRFHLPGNVAVGAFHKDADFGHPPGEDNFILPLTDSYDTASIWVESKPGKEDFTPMRLRHGECILFNGNRLTHGNKVNQSDFSRVSLDFRILPASLYNPNYEGQSVTRNTKFRIGAYYNLLKAE